MKFFCRYIHIKFIACEFIQILLKIIQGARTHDEASTSLRENNGEEELGETMTLHFKFEK